MPSAWTEAVADLSSTQDQRVLQLPGSEFGAFRWGYTVDPPLPGLADEPLVTRDLLPLGSAGAMDLLYTLDDRFQGGTQEAAAVVAVARFLGVDTIWVANDLAFDRFRTPRPEVVSDFFGRPIDGLTEPRYGVPEINVPDVPMVDEQELSDPRIGVALAPVELVDVEESGSRSCGRATRSSCSPGAARGSSTPQLRVSSMAAKPCCTPPTSIRTNWPISTPSVLARPCVSSSPTPTGTEPSNGGGRRTPPGSPSPAGTTTTSRPRTRPTTVSLCSRRRRVRGRDGGNQTTAQLDDGLVVQASAYGEPFAYRPGGPRRHGGRR